jgi:signal transduction histidine kinase
LFRHPDRTIEQESETISQVIQEINYMTRMTKDLLTLARSDAREVNMIKVPIQLDLLLNQVVKDFKGLADSKKIRLEADIASPIEMQGDPERVKQCIVILLDNALKYTKKGRIQVAAHIRNGRAIIEIIDTGVGIPEEDLPFIFDRYYRGDPSRTRQFEGTGLGLSIAKWIVQSHGGKIRVMSKVGKGTHVQVSFPLKMKS